MSNALTKAVGTPLALKGRLAELLGDQLQHGDDLSSGVSVGFPVLSIKGKNFHVKQGGESTLITAPNSEDPAFSLEVVLVKANPHQSKVFYEGGYEEGSEDAPTCYSNKGDMPETDAADPQSPTCATCKHNQWGSRTTDNGKRGKACSDSRRVAVSAAGDIPAVMLLRVPAASLTPLMKYGRELSKRGVPYQAIVTKLSFDPSASHPLLTFRPVRPVTEAEAEQIAEAIQSEVTQAILYGNASPIAAGDEPEPEVGEEAEFDKIAAASRAAAAKAAKAPKTPVVTETAVAEALAEADESTAEDDEEAKLEAALAAAKERKAAAKGAAKAAADKPAKAPKTTKAASAAVAGTEVTEGALDDLLSQFKFDDQ
jgi:hypothetical protein